MLSFLNAGCATPENLCARPPTVCGFLQETVSPHKLSLCLLLLNYSGEDLSSETREELALFLLKEIKVTPEYWLSRQIDPRSLAPRPLLTSKRNLLQICLELYRWAALVSFVWLPEDALITHLSGRNCNMMVTLSLQICRTRYLRNRPYLFLASLAV